MTINKNKREMTNLRGKCNICDRQGSIPLICKELLQISGKKDPNRGKKIGKRHGQKNYKWQKKERERERGEEREGEGGRGEREKGKEEWRERMYDFTSKQGNANKIYFHLWNWQKVKRIMWGWWGCRDKYTPIMYCEWWYKLVQLFRSALGQYNRGLKFIHFDLEHPIIQWIYQNCSQESMHNTQWYL